jgi:hypothetical protein
VNVWFLLLLTSAATYTVARVWILDSLFEEIREGIVDRLTTGDTGYGETRPIHNHEIAWLSLPLWKRKLSTLLTCPHCLTAWMGAAVLGLTEWLVAGVSIPAPVLFWLGTWTGALVFWAIIDHE